MTSTFRSIRLTRAWQVGLFTATCLVALAMAPAELAAQSALKYASGVHFAVPVPRSHEPPASSAAPPFAGANITVNSPTAQQQNETSIAINLNNPSNLIGGANDYRNGDSACGRYFSTTNGRTWTDLGTFPMFTGAGTTTAFTAAGDPGIAIDANGHAYYLCMYLTRNPDGTAAGDATQYVHKSNNGGAMWGPPIQVSSAAARSNFDDKGHIAVDNKSSTANSGNIYVAWGRLNQNQLRFARSTDGGASFQNDQQLNDGNTAATGANIAVGIDGAVYVAWFDGTNNQIRIDKSTNGGQNFGALTGGTDHTIRTLTPIGSVRPLTRVDSFPVIATDAFDAQILYAVWAENPTGNDDSDIMFARSTDGGNIWSTSPVRINDDINLTGDFNSQFFPWMAVDPIDGSINIVWYDDRLDPNHMDGTPLVDLFFASSTDRGLSFGVNKRVSTQSSDTTVGFGAGAGQFFGDYTAITAYGGVAYPLWTDSRNGTQDVMTTQIGRPGRFAYVANFDSNGLSAYAIDQTTGALSSLPGSPFSFLRNLASVAVAPTGRFVYATISPSVAVVPTGQVVYATDSFGASVSVLRVDSSSGALTPVSGSPFTVTGHGVAAYAVDSATGALNQISGSPFPTGLDPDWVTVHPTGNFVYVANGLDDAISVYEVDPSTGALAEILTSPVPAGARPRSIAIDPAGTFAYTANYNSNDLSAYTIDSSTGVLTPVVGSPFAAGSSPRSVAVDPSGRFLYAANSNSNNVSAYSINAATGVLTPVPSSPFSAGTAPASISVEPRGLYVYVVNTNANNVSAFVIDNATGSLTPMQGSPFPGVLTPLGVATSAGPLVAPAPPTISKSFGAATIPLNGTTNLSFTLSNPNEATALSGVGVSDSLPSGLVIATPNGVTGSCGGGMITATAGAGTVSLSGATLAASGSCTFAVNVTGTTAGVKNNITGNVTSLEGGSGGTASASVAVVTPALAPTANTGAATGVTSSTATLNGTVNPNGLATTANFEWGTTTSYGNITSSQSIGSGTANVSVAANLTGLAANTPYHYRVVASNSAGTTFGADGVLTTSATHTLTVASVNPSSGVGITMSPVDNGGLGSGTTPLSRVYDHNALVNLTAPMAVGANTFQKWQRDGVDVSTSAGVQVTVDADHTLRAVYVNQPPGTPGSLGQFKSNRSTTIGVGGSTDETTVVLKGAMSDPAGNTVKLQVEVRSLGTGFSNTATQESSLVSSGSQASVTVSGLTNSTSYHWQARAVDSQGAASGWVAFGGNAESAADFTALTPTAVSVTPPPTPLSVTPPSGSGSRQTFSYLFSDPNGFADIVSAQMLLNSSLSAVSGCYVFFSPGLNALWLRNDAGTAWQGPVTPGSRSTLQNSQCTLNAAGSSSSGSGTNLTVNVSLTFKPAFTGAKTNFMETKDGVNQTSNWRAMGTFTVI